MLPTSEEAKSCAQASLALCQPSWGNSWDATSCSHLILVFQIAETLLQRSVSQNYFSDCLSCLEKALPKHSFHTRAFLYLTILLFFAFFIPELFLEALLCAGLSTCDVFPLSFVGPLLIIS